MYEYTAKVTNVVDGDTIDVDIDLGFDVHINTRLRLAGVNCAELNTPEGVLARRWTQYNLLGTTVTIKTDKDKKEKYGRYLAVVEVPSWSYNFNDALIKKGYAVAYDGKGKVK